MSFMWLQINETRWRSSSREIRRYQPCLSDYFSSKGKKSWRWSLLSTPFSNSFFCILAKSNQHLFFPYPLWIVPFPTELHGTAARFVYHWGRQLESAIELSNCWYRWTKISFLSNAWHMWKKQWKKEFVDSYVGVKGWMTMVATLWPNKTWTLCYLCRQL